jgi:hypothetical protein
MSTTNDNCEPSLLGSLQRPGRPTDSMNTLKIPCEIGQVSDGYHTFDELYEHRCTLFIALMKSHPELAWFSDRHSDGGKLDGWFIAGMTLPTGDVTYHLPVKFIPLAEATGATVMFYGKEWDGHDANDVVQRIQEWCMPTK